MTKVSGFSARLFAGAAIALLATSHASAATTVKQAGFKVVDLAVPFLAKSKGFFEKNDLDWQYVEIDSGKLGVAALLSGDVQFVDLGLDDVARLQELGKDPIGIYSMVNSLTMDLVVSDKAMESAGLSPTMDLEEKLAHLKGLKFGITRRRSNETTVIRTKGSTRRANGSKLSACRRRTKTCSWSPVSVNPV